MKSIKTMLRITFQNNKATKKFLLEVFGKTIDQDNNIVEKETKEKVLGSDGQPITLDEFGGIKNGSEIFIKNDIVSLVGFYRKYLADKK